MSSYILWVYTKHGNKKRYEVASPNVLDPKTGNIAGECLASGVNFAIPLANVDVYEWRPSNNGKYGKE